MAPVRHQNEIYGNLYRIDTYFMFCTKVFVSELQKSNLIQYPSIGCGKTLLLDELEAAGEKTLNLERMAGHKGSIFGGAGGQSTQRVFEARLHRDLRRCLTACHVWTECESRSIGPGCQLSDGFWRRLRDTRGTARIWLSAPLEARVNWILRDYAGWLEDSEEKLEWVLKT